MSLFYYLSVLAMAAMPAAAAAQAAPSANAADAGAVVAAHEYKSAFESYQSMADSDATPASAWRAANDEVGRIGGHAGSMRSAQESAARAKDSAAEWSPVAPHTGHGGHHH